MTAPDLPRSLTDRVSDMHQSLIETHRGVLDRATIEGFVRRELPLCGPAQVAGLTDLLSGHVHGLGPLDRLLGDQSISEVMVNGPGPVWVERDGTLIRTDTILDATAIRLAIDRIIGPLGLRVDRLVPFVDARLDDGSRVHVTVPPMAVDGPYLSIRRFPARVLPIEQFANATVAALVRDAVLARQNILVTGATGAGKTSLVNTLGSMIESHERIVTIEDTAELRLASAHVVRLEARPPTAEGLGEITMRTLVRNALRMRPDRLIVGEVRGPEAFDMIQALGTGHSGSLSTCHANSPAEALDRLTSMVLMADAPIDAILARRMIDTALDLVVHVERVASGRRLIQSVVSVTPDIAGVAVGAADSQ